MFKKLILFVSLMLFSNLCFAEEAIIIHRELTEQEQIVEQIRREERDKRLKEWVKEITQREHELKLEEIKYKVLLETQLLIAEQSKPNIEISVYNDSYSGTKSITTSEATAKSESNSTSVGISKNKKE